MPFDLDTAFSATSEARVGPVNARPVTTSTELTVPDPNDRLFGVNGLTINEMKERRRAKYAAREGKKSPNLQTSWRTICSMEIQGHNKKDIAQALKVNPVTITKITSDPRYLELRDKILGEMDRDFVAMKPLAFKALRNGLTSTDENIALRASEQWFKGAGFGGYSKTAEPSPTLSAEDIVQRLLQVNVQVNVNNDK